MKFLIRGGLCGELTGWGRLVAYIIAVNVHVHVLGNYSMTDGKDGEEPVNITIAFVHFSEKTPILKGWPFLIIQAKSGESVETVERV